ncbi:hypothetical protein UPYG_G00221470 [Umbra pygmaea]|uniref:Cardiolipin synthase (CMP-forming) n=1 Tax=Umbra pygmaea TaxID=75934 RepID=A0ABD0WGR3_UMBPY
MFFLSVCKKSFAVFAQRHVANVTRCSRRSVYRASPASWQGQQTQQQGVCVRAEGEYPQGLKDRSSFVAQWDTYTHNSTKSEVTGNWHALKGPLKRATLSCHRRGHERTQGWRGLCSGKPRETAADRPPGEDLKETTQPADGPPDPGQGLFKFKELYENPWTIPNLLCVCRIALAPVLAVLITEQHFHLSLGLFALAGFTDVLDGYIARNWASQKSALGSALDPLADKILISVLYVSLTYAQLIPAPLTVLVIARDIGLIAAVFYVRYKTVPLPVTLSKFFNPCYTTAQLKPTTLSKVNTAIQLFLVAASLASPVFHYTDSLLLQALWYVTAVTTTVSGYSYYHYGMKTVAVLNSTK